MKIVNIVKKHKIKTFFLLVLVTALSIFTTMTTQAEVTAPSSFTANSENFLLVILMTGVMLN